MVEVEVVGYRMQPHGQDCEVYTVNGVTFLTNFHNGCPTVFWGERRASSVLKGCLTFTLESRRCPPRRQACAQEAALLS